MTNSKRPFHRSAALLGAAIGCTALLALPASAATFYTPPVSAQPGGTANVCVWMSDGNNEVAGAQMDISWEPSCMVPASGGSRPKCRSNPDTGKTVQSATRGASTLRAIMISFSDVEPIPDGELFCCEFRIVDNPSGSACGLSFSNVIASTPGGQRTDARLGRSSGVNIGRSGGAPAAGGGAPAAPAGGDAVAADRPDQGSAPEAPAGEAAAGGAPGEAAAAPGGAAGSGAADAASGGLGGRPLPGAEAVDVDARRQALGDTAGRRAADDMGEVADAPADRIGDAAAAAADDDATGDPDATTTPAADATPTPAAEATAQRTVTAAALPTATRAPASPTPAEPTPSPTVSSGFLGGCTLMVE